MIKKRFERLPDLKITEGITLKLQAIFLNDKRDPVMYQISIDRDIYRVSRYSKDPNRLRVVWANKFGWLNINKHKNVFKPEFTGPYNHVDYFVDDEIAKLLLAWY